MCASIKEIKYYKYNNAASDKQNYLSSTIFETEKYLVLEKIFFTFLILFQDSLRDLVNAGVVGFKCFLCPSGVEEFPHVERKDLVEALKALEGTGSVLAVGDLYYFNPRFYQLQ